jgi:hypothetical protein
MDSQAYPVQWESAISDATQIRESEFDKNQNGLDAYLACWSNGVSRK